MRCPFCGGAVKKRPEYVPMSFKRRSVFQFIQEAGPKGIEYKDLKDRFFAKNSDTTIRTTLHYINKAIRPVKIECHGSKLRVLPAEH